MALNITESIKKYDMSLVLKDGQEMVRVGKPPKSVKITEELKAAKADIIAELKLQETEKEKRIAARQAQMEADAQEYLKTADLRRCFVISHDDLNYEKYFATLEFSDTQAITEKGKMQAFSPRHGGTEVYRMVAIDKDSSSEIIRTITTVQPQFAYGWNATAWEVTPEQEERLVIESTTVKEAKVKDTAKKKAAKELAAAEKKRQDDEARAEMKVEILKKFKGRRGPNGDDGEDPYVIVEISDPSTGEKGKFNCRNIFDFGYVVNPYYAVAEGLEPGGLDHTDKDNGKRYWQTFDPQRTWYNVRELTPFEVKALDYLEKFPPIYSGIRM